MHPPPDKHPTQLKSMIHGSALYILFRYNLAWLTLFIPLLTISVLAYRAGRDWLALGADFITFLSLWTFTFHLELPFLYNPELERWLTRATLHKQGQEGPDFSIFLLTSSTSASSCAGFLLSLSLCRSVVIPYRLIPSFYRLWAGPPSFSDYYLLLTKPRLSVNPFSSFLFIQPHNPRL